MRDFTSEMRKVADHLESARKILTQGSLDYYFRKLVEHSEALMGFAKYKIGDKAELKHDIPCTDGWVGSEKHLTKGTTGKIDSVDYANGHFIYYFKFLLINPKMGISATVSGNTNTSPPRIALFLIQKFVLL
jgi:hypothetical protein